MTVAAFFGIPSSFSLKVLPITNVIGPVIGVPLLRLNTGIGSHPQNAVLKRLRFVIWLGHYISMAEE